MKAKADRRRTKALVYDGFAIIAKGLANGRRLEILDLLAQRDGSVQEIADELGESMANTSQHLRVLERSGLVASRRQGNHVIYALARPEVGLLLDTIRSIGAEQLESVEQLISEHLGRRDEIAWITKSELVRRLRKHEVVLIDTRPRADFEASHITGAISMPVDEIERRIAELPVDKDVVAYCRGPFCAFADEAVRALNHHGRRALRLEDGLPAWTRAGLPTTVD
jgi:DNA-binding transcriptional ArsR family regulator